ncbi:MAG: hypothetical protein KME10_24380 [Plectolyngbya sp. WJT66-NPBG17]|jgi:hypothetical protein|nr:hypothetical protein [Plectolyngbya sp. WJT66-NPBG17]
MTRRVAGIVVIDGTDDETWPFSDEHGHLEKGVDTILDEGQPASVITVPALRWGGECRVELEMLAQVVQNNAVQITGTAKLFEGTSEDTDDLEDQRQVNFTVPKGGIPVRRQINLRNSGIGGGDHAEIYITFTNSIYEQPD